MHLNLIRDPSYNSATVGRLLIDGIFECWTLEDQVREDDSQQVEVWKVRGQTAIPRGEYVVVIDFSNRFRQEMPRLLNVPGFDGIRIHAGNYAGNKTLFSKTPIPTLTDVLLSVEYVEVFDDIKEG